MIEPATTNADIEATAVDWFVRLQGDAELADWEAFQTWLEADPTHAAAYDAVEAMWVDLEDPDLAATQAEPSGDGVVTPFRPRPQRRALWLGGAAAAAAAVFAVLLLPPMMAPAYVNYATTKGETRAVTLSDGSHINLGGDTKLRVRLTKSERDVDLLNGEASFDVAHQAARPFVVGVGAREVRVLGTEFNIRRHADELTVTVRRGVVSVASAGGGQGVKLTKGQQLTASSPTVPPVVRSADPDEAFAWTTGKLVYRETPLPQVVADLNRYVSTPIRVDPSAAWVKVSGVLVIDKEQAMIERLKLFTPITAETVGGEIVLKARAARP
jgi:transmembrane sensor